MAQPKIQTRLCPHCANSIAVDAITCPYCKADLLQSNEPEWPQRDEEFERPSSSVEKKTLTVKSKAILIGGLLLFALGVYLVGGNRERSDLGPVLQQREEALQERDATIKNLETQLADLRQEQQGSTKRIDELRTKLDKTEKDLVATRKKLNDANHEIERLKTTRTASAQRAAPRTAERTPAPSSGSASRAFGGLEPGTYETMRSISVYEGPASSSRIVTKVGKGTQVTVVRSIGNWVEIRSKHGNPPGFVHAEDLAPISRSK